MAFKEYGFWEYTPSNCESLCLYDDSDWDILLDDMAEGGMNSLVVMVKHYVSGYRSSLPWLDQPSDNSIIARDNRPLRRAILEARKRNICVWLGAVCNMFQIPPFDILPCLGKMCGSMGVYDQDQEGLTERMVALCADIVDLFPGIDGLVVEMENVETIQPHRVKLYDEWAQVNNEMSFAEIESAPLDMRWQKQFTPLRKYLTDSRARVCSQIERVVREKGFTGKLALITEGGNQEACYLSTVHFPRLKKKLPDWAVITYGYERHLNRYAATEFCIAGPIKAGHEVYYLPRGLLTWKGNLPIPLKEHWRIDIEDALNFPLTGLWWFGADALGEHTGSKSYCSAAEIRKQGFQDGLDARRQLIRMCREAGVTTQTG